MAGSAAESVASMTIGLLAMIGALLGPLRLSSDETLPLFGSSPRLLVLGRALFAAALSVLESSLLLLARFFCKVTKPYPWRRGMLFAALAAVLWLNARRIK
jgi:hypothetical protein